MRKPVVAVVQGRSPLFVNQPGLPRSLGSLTDVDLSNLEDGSLLVYDEDTEKFQASRLLEKQNINGGHF